MAVKNVMINMVVIDAKRDFTIIVLITSSEVVIVAKQKSLKDMMTVINV